MPETSSNVVYGNAKPCNLFSNNLLALDLNCERSLQVPGQSLRGIRRQLPALFDRSSRRRDQSGHIASHSQLQATDEVNAVQLSQEEKNADDAKSGTMGPHFTPHSNITTQNAREADSSSRATGIESPQEDIRGHPVELGQG